MCDIKIISLQIENFKGISRREILFGGRNYNIYGDNATGKTSVYDALTWLLFGKSSDGRTNFNIKPLGREGQVRSHDARTTVVGVFDIGGDAYEFKKVYYEKWTQKRGNPEASYDGNTTEYYIDGLMVQKYKYDDAISNFISEDIFKMLTGIYYFNTLMSWQERRKILFEMCGQLSEAEILESKETFAPLRDKLGRFSVEEFKSKMSAERKNINKTLHDLPVRIEENKALLAPLEQIDFETLEQEITKKRTEADALQQQISRMENDAEGAAAQNRMDAARNEIDRLKAQNMEFRAKQQAEILIDNRAQTLMMQEEGQLRELALLQDAVSQAQNQIAIYETRMEQKREQYKQQEAAPLLIEDTCPTCGRKFEADKIESVKKELRKTKDASLAHINAEGKQLAEEKQGCEEKKKILAEQVDKMLSEINKTKQQIKALPPKQSIEIKDLDGYAEQLQRLEQRYVQEKASFERIMKDKESEKETLMQKLDGCRFEEANLQKELAKRDLITQIQNSIEVLQAQRKELAGKLEDADRLIYLCEEFIREKVRSVEENVNLRFEKARFKLFHVQENGALAECCEATFDGKPYSDLNNGMRINIGLDIIAALSRFYKTRAPIFVDNAESVTALQKIDTQMVRLVVSEKDKELRCEAA